MDCYHYFRMYVQGEQLFLSMYGPKIIQFIFMFLLWTGIILSIFFLDNWLKDKAIRETIIQAQRTMNITASNYADQLGYDKKVKVRFSSNGNITVEIDNT